MNEQLQIYNIGLLSLTHNLKDISTKFIDISFSHVYREHNAQAYSLSKEGLHLPQNFISEEEHLGGCIVFVKFLSLDVY
jgi:hypothetical protein